MTYTTIGMVYGCCGHRHKTLEEAERCVLRFLETRSFSDRTVRRLLKDGTTELLDVHESIEANRIHSRLKQKEQRR